MKSKYRARIVSSILVICLSLTSLIGSTFAWFTDSVKTQKNRIVSGNLDVEMYFSNASTGTTGDAKNWENVNAVSATKPNFFVDKDGHAMLWEPGVATYTNFKVVNEGSVALQYYFRMATDQNQVEFNGELHDLTEVIKIAVIETERLKEALTAAPGDFPGVSVIEGNDHEGTVEDIVQFASREEMLAAADKMGAGFKNINEWTFQSTLEATTEINEENNTRVEVANFHDEQCFVVLMYWKASPANYESNPVSKDDLYNLKNGKKANSKPGFDDTQLGIDIDIQLWATQYTEEIDGFSKFYDQQAQLNVVKSVSRVDENYTTPLQFSFPKNTAAATDIDETSTTVDFPAGAFGSSFANAGGKITMELTTTAPTDSNNNFVVEAYNGQYGKVAELDFKLDYVAQNAFNNINPSSKATVHTVILPNLEGVTVNNGATNVQYDPETGALSFETNHFSTFNVRCDAKIEQNGSYTVYNVAGLKTAIAAGKNYTLASDLYVNDNVNGKIDNKLDLNGHNLYVKAYTVVDYENSKYYADHITGYGIYSYKVAEKTGGYAYVYSEKTFADNADKANIVLAAQINLIEGTYNKIISGTIDLNGFTLPTLSDPKAFNFSATSSKYYAKYTNPGYQLALKDSNKAYVYDEASVKSSASNTSGLVLLNDIALSGKNGIAIKGTIDLNGFDMTVANATDLGSEGAKYYAKKTASGYEIAQQDANHSYVYNEETLASAEKAIVLTNSITLSKGQNLSITEPIDFNGLSLYATDAADFDSVSSGYYAKKLVNDNGYEIVLKETGVEYVGTQDALVSACAEGTKTVVLVKDIALTTNLDVNGTVTLDLNGNKLTAADSFSGTQTSGLVVVHRGANLTVNDESNAGSIISANIYSAIVMTHNDDAGDAKATLTVNGGKIMGYYYGISGNGKRHGTEITVNGGVIKGTCPNDNLGIYHPQDGTLTVNGGEISGYSSAIELRAGTLNISGGKLTATATDYSVSANGNGNTTVGAALAIAPHTTNKQIIVTVTGGSFTGVKAFSARNPESIETPAVTINLGEGITGEIENVFGVAN